MPFLLLAGRVVALAGLAAFLPAAAAVAEDGVLVVQVTGLDGKPMAGVGIGMAAGGPIELTDEMGRARLGLGAEEAAGRELTLQVVPGGGKESLVFISPWNRRVLVPAGGRPVPVVLAMKSDKEALTASSLGRQAVLQSILGALGRQEEARAEPYGAQRRAVLQAQAAAYGLRLEDVEAAIRAAVKAPDLYEQGLAALCEKSYPLASERLAEALEASEREPERARQKVADRAFFLGQSLVEQGRYSQAVAAYRKTAELRGNDPQVLNRLGMSLSAGGDYPAAEASLRQALDAARKTNSDLQGSVAANLALVLEEKGDLPGARLIEERILEERRRSLGPDHPDTLWALQNLAETLHAQGDLARARTFQEQVLQARRTSLGNDHPDTLSAMSELAATLAAQGDRAEARQLGQQVVEARRRLLGPDHPDTLLAMGNLAENLRAQGALETARVLEEQILEARRRTLGPESPDTLLAMTNLAATLGDQGDSAGARKLEEQVVVSSLRVLGRDHPHTLSALANLAVTLSNLGHHDQARPLEEQVLKSRRRQLGPRHPETTLAEWNLLQTCLQLKDEAGYRKLEKDLAWLLGEEDAKLSAQQREIREGLKDLERQAKH
ncbi:MAG TPA: tetratricopeptide repeat protein [Thermoanaerobaculia bacterium]|nr:tetratricopeptide repeat protein [Thermoanaerobaculia bacterium]